MCACIPRLFSGFLRNGERDEDRTQRVLLKTVPTCAIQLVSNKLTLYSVLHGEGPHCYANEIVDTILLFKRT